MGREGKSTACTHVYLYIGRSWDLRRRKWGSFWFMPCLSAGNKKSAQMLGHWIHTFNWPSGHNAEITSITDTPRSHAEYRAIDGECWSPPAWPETLRDQGSGAALYRSIGVGEAHLRAHKLYHAKCRQQTTCKLTCTHALNRFTSHYCNLHKWLKLRWQGSAPRTG